MTQQQRNERMRVEAAADVTGIDGQPYRRPLVTPWEQSLRRMARAQALLWHRTGIKERIAILAEVDQEQNGAGQ